MEEVKEVMEEKEDHCNGVRDARSTPSQGSLQSVADSTDLNQSMYKAWFFSTSVPSDLLSLVFLFFCLYFFFSTHCDEDFYRFKTTKYKPLVDIFKKKKSKQKQEHLETLKTLELLCAHSSRIRYIYATAHNSIERVLRVTERQ